MKTRGGLAVAPAAALMALIACGIAAHAAEPRALRHNPFAVPPTARAPLAGSTSTPAAPAELAAPAVPWQPRLRAVVVSPSGSMALVDGAVVALGEELEGHRLVHVAERSATFTKNGVRVELKMDGAGAAPR